jgi:hypothetical protein
MTCEETAKTCLERRKARQRQWEQLVTETLQQAAGNSGPLNPKHKLPTDLNDSIASVEEWQAQEDGSSVESAIGMEIGGGEYAGPAGGAGTGGGGRASLDCGNYGAGLLLGDAGDAAGLLSWRQQVLFRGMRVRMSVATGYVDSVRVHSVTKRREYTGDVLNKVQALGEAPHGGQVLLDPETFKGVYNRLAELGGVVLEVVEKMSFAYFACKTLPAHISEHAGRF